MTTCTPRSIWKNRLILFIMPFKFLYYEDMFSPNATDELVHSLNQPLINSIVESDKNNAHVVVDITQAEISGNIVDTMQHDTVKQNLTKLLAASKTVSTLGAHGTDYRILKQRIAINKYDIVIVNYRHLSKSYSLLIHGTNTKTVYVKTSPIHQLVDNYLASAGQLFKQKEYSQAFDLVEKILNISPEKAEAKELKKEILNRINAEYALGGLSGGLITTLLFRLAWAHNSLPFWGNTWWETIKVSILLFVGVLTGLVTAAIFADKGATKIKESRKRVLYPFIVSILSTIILVVSWNLATERLWGKNPETNVEDWFKKGNSLADSGNYKDAITTYNKVVEVDPNHVRAYYNRGLSYVELKNYQEAVSTFDTVIKLAPNNAGNFITRGSAYGKLGDKQRQIDDYKTAARMGDKQVQEVLKEANIEW